MIIFPAIDIRGGKCVRLVQGDYARETVFGDRPADMARRWLEEGAAALHIVDLDGARSGSSDNRESVAEILRTVETLAAGRTVKPVVQLGGGIRDLDAIDSWIATGLDRVILGTAAVRDPSLVDRAAKRHPGRVWVGIDAREGQVAVSGWTETTARTVVEFAADMQTRGAGGVVYTDIGRDGTGKGVDVEGTAALVTALDIPVIASGGVHAVADVTRLCSAAPGRIAGVIVGRALYDGDVKLGELLAAAR
jgi:phosphoribosylformimino-5-aminoimidazole carboxamide ribotide isomerase